MRRALSQLALLLFAELFALLLYLDFFHAQLFVEIEKNLSVQPKLPGTLTSPPCRIRVRLRCPKRLHLTAHNVYVRLPPLQLAETPQKLPVAIFAPSVCTLLSYRPKHCTFHLATAYQLTLPVKTIGLDFDPEEVFSQPPLLTPPFVQLKGSRQDVLRAAAALIVLKRSDFKKPTPISRKPVILDSEGRELHLSPVPSEVSIALVPFPKIKRELKVFPRFLSQTFNGQLKSFEVIPPTAWAEGDPRDVLNLTSLQTKPIALSQPAKTLRAEIEPPKNIKVHPRWVTVRLHFQPPAPPELPSP